MRTLALSLTALLFSVIALADVRLPGIFGDNMVLQRDQKIPVWGWASAGERITVQFNRQSLNTKAGKDGRWKVELRPEQAGGPFRLVVKGRNQLVADNVLVGEVWLCSGQSNMEWYVSYSADKRYAEEIRKADNPHIRHFKVKRAIAQAPAEDITGGEWKPGDDSANVSEFSSVGYFFAQKLYEALKVPIGLVNSSWGGSCVETWISREALDGHGEFKDAVQKSFAEAGVQAENGEYRPNNYPSLLFNGMIHPIVPYAIRGALWYQGEANAARAAQYKQAFPLMIRDWRSRWGQADFPFYFVQLASWKADDGNSRKGSAWAELREAQTSTLSLPNTGMAVTLDIGDYEDIHPSNKKDVGLRLAAVALHKTYGKPGEFSGPLFKSMNTNDRKVTLSFTHTGSGLWVKDDYGYLKGFEVAGPDRRFYYAKAEVKDDKVIVYSDSVQAPVAVRYGWADNMPEANLYNREGFPAVPFRTDDWKGITDEQKYVIR